MAPIIFYNDLVSQPCRALYIFMKANNIDFKSVTIDLLQGQHHDEEYGKIHPFNRVPVIDDNGFILSESAAIYRYLARKFKVPEHWYPSSNLAQQVRVDEYLNWHHSSIRYPTVMVFQHQFVKAMQGRQANMKEVTEFKQRLGMAIKHLEKYFLRDNDFLCGNEVSVADIQALCELHQLVPVSDDGLFMSNPKLKAWAGRVKASTQPFFDESFNAGVGKLKELYTQSKL